MNYYECECKYELILYLKFRGRSVFGQDMCKTDTTVHQGGPIKVTELILGGLEGSWEAQGIEAECCR